MLGLANWVCMWTSPIWSKIIQESTTCASADQKIMCTTYAHINHVTITIWFFVCLFLQSFALLYQVMTFSRTGNSIKYKHDIMTFGHVHLVYYTCRKGTGGEVLAVYFPRQGRNLPCLVMLRTTIAFLPI